MTDRFAIKYDERGIQLHNDYIGKIAQGINTYYKRQGSPLYHPEHTYGIIHKHRHVLEVWEKILAEKGLL